MSIEVLVFFYMSISIAMGLFEFFYLQHERLHFKLFGRLSTRMTADLSREIRENADFPTEEHKARLERALSRMSGCEAFDLTMDKLAEESEDLAQRYLRGIADVFDATVPAIERKSDLHKAYFAYLISKWYRPYRSSRATKDRPVVHFLLGGARNPSLYVRQNAVDAIAHISNAGDLNVALLWMSSDESVFYHPRLLTETALSFHGPHEDLAAKMRASFYSYPSDARPAIINYWRMTATGDKDQLVNLLHDGSLDPETRMATMRYFGSHPDDHAYETLCQIADGSSSPDWEYAVVAVRALAAYPTPHTVGLLKNRLSDPSWFVRNAAAQSLMQISKDYDIDFTDVLGSDDRYAREMLAYHIEQSRMPAEAGGAAT